MPVVFTFDLRDAPPTERNRIQSFFERFGWENISGSSYRYPRLSTSGEPVEDWFNHVVPALMLFRTYILSSGRQLPQFTIDVQSSAGYNSATQFGSPPQRGHGKPKIQLYASAIGAFAELNLRDWLDSMTYPY